MDKPCNSRRKFQMTDLERLEIAASEALKLRKLFELRFKSLELENKTLRLVLMSHYSNSQ